MYIYLRFRVQIYIFQVGLVVLSLHICMGVEPNEYESIRKRPHEVVILFNLVGLFERLMCVFIHLDCQYSIPNEDVVVDASIVERVACHVCVCVLVCVCVRVYVCSLTTVTLNFLRRLPSCVFVCETTKKKKSARMRGRVRQKGGKRERGRQRRT